MLQFVPPRACVVVVVIGLVVSSVRAQTTVPSPVPSQPVTSTTAPGAGLAPASPAAPQPNPRLTEDFMPPRRGFFRADPFFVYPSIAMGFGHTSNLVGTSTNPLSTNFWVVAPKIVAEARGGGHSHYASYSGNYGRYTGSSADNYDDHELVVGSDNQFDARTSLNGRLFYLDRVDPRGSVARTISAEPDHYRALGGNATFAYGARAAQGRLEFDVGVTDKTYTNNRTVTELFDVTSFDAGGRFLYRVSPRARLLAEVRGTHFDYRSALSRLDNNEMRYLGGVTWDIAAATTGTVKVGWMTKSFSNPTLKNYSGANVDATLRWSPRSYSAIDLLARRSAIDSAGTGIFTVDTLAGASWTHRWSAYHSTRVLATHVHSDFQGVSRTDRFSTLSVAGYVDLRTWIRLGIEFTHQRRSSTDPTAPFTRNLLLFSAAATI